MLLTSSWPLARVGVARCDRLCHRSGRSGRISFPTLRWDGVLFYVSFGYRTRSFCRFQVPSSWTMLPFYIPSRPPRPGYLPATPGPWRLSSYTLLKCSLAGDEAFCSVSSHTFLKSLLARDEAFCLVLFLYLSQMYISKR